MYISICCSIIIKITSYVERSLTPSFIHNIYLLNLIVSAPSTYLISKEA